MGNWESLSASPIDALRRKPRIGRPRRRNTLVDLHALKSELGYVSHLENSLSIASRGARWLGALPEACHLLPSAAIESPQNCLRPFQPFQFFSLPVEGVLTSLSLVSRLIGYGSSVLGPHSLWRQALSAFEPCRNFPIRAIGRYPCVCAAALRLTSRAGRSERLFVAIQYPDGGNLMQADSIDIRPLITGDLRLSDVRLDQGELAFQTFPGVPIVPPVFSDVTFFIRRGCATLQSMASRPDCSSGKTSACGLASRTSNPSLVAFLFGAAPIPGFKAGRNPPDSMDGTVRTGASLYLHL